LGIVGSQNRRQDAGATKSAPSHHSVDGDPASDLLPERNLSDANVAKATSLFGDWFLNFGVQYRDGNYFSFVLRGL